jgi:hypothetical protein
LIQANIPHEGRLWLPIGYASGLLVSILLGYFLLRIPVQLYDCFTDMCALLQPMDRLMRDAFTLPGYFRPGRWIAMKLVFDLSGGDYFLGFRQTQAVQVIAVVVLFVRLLQPTSGTAASVLPLALAALVGSHTFAWTVREGLPINHFLTIVLCCVAAANVSFARHRWWTDVLAVLLFIAAASTLESGLLLWVIFVTGYLVGLKGVSRTGLIAVTVLLAAYFYVRFVALGTGTPSLGLREAGFGFTRYTGEELVARFGDNPYGFYLYNVVASFLGVLIAEPRHGVWTLTRGIVQGTLEPALVINVVSSTLATLVIGRFAWRRRHAWLARTFTRSDQIVLLFVAMLVANAVMSYPYTKDAIMSPAGLFFAAALYAASIHLVESGRHQRRLVAACSAVVLVVLSAGWAVRLVGIHVALDITAVQVRQQWATVDERMPALRPTLTPAERALAQRLQDDAIRRHPAKPQIRDEWARLFDLE